MKNKGFTLIELLAVITILSIILTITVIAIGGAVNDSKKNLHNTQINQIEKAAEYYNNKEGLNDETICVNVKTLVDKGYLKDGEVKDPSSDKNFDGSVVISYNEKKYSYIYQKNKCLCEPVNDEISKEIGTKYVCEVKENTKFNFYVLSTNEDDTFNLIMDSNICSSDDDSINGTLATNTNKCTLAWHAGDSTNNYGPDTAMQGLYEATKDWINVPDIIMNYLEGELHNKNDNTKGYESIITNPTTKITTIKARNDKTDTSIGTSYNPLKARLSTQEEVMNLGCKLDQQDSCEQSWLTENLDSSIIKGYWLLAAYDGYDDFVRILEQDGRIGYNSPQNTSKTGIRPVITISIENISQK